MSLTPRLSFLLPDRVRIRVVLLAVFGAILLGTVVFHVLEGWSILDSLYVTVQTVTTVGFGDLTPRTPCGRAFAVVFMMVSVGIVLYALTSTVQTIVHSELFATYGRSRKMSKLRDHFIICGAGRVGSHLIRNLRAANATFLSDRDRLRKSGSTDGSRNRGPAARCDARRNAARSGVEHARGLATCLPDDATTST